MVTSWAVKGINRAQWWFTNTVPQRKETKNWECPRGRPHSLRPFCRAMLDPSTDGNSMQHENPWEGRRFICTQCGKCCTGSGEVWISEEEVEKISDYLKVLPHQFYPRYTKGYSRRPGWYLLRSYGFDQACIFLKDKACTIHPVRPRQCSTYPWWPDLLEQESWEYEREYVCEGLDHPEAEPCDLEVAREQLQLATLHFAARDCTAMPGRSMTMVAAQGYNLSVDSDPLSSG
eukprot:jgi/Botrbrau1/12508/Bobra.0169s0050.1